MTRVVHFSRHTVIATVLFIPWLAFTATADMNFSGDPIPLTQAAGKSGAIRVTLPERSPLSPPSEILKRLHAKGVPTVDYEWSKEVYDVYIPKEPGEGGKYGVMVGAVFKDYGAPPGDWGDLLDKHHVIWICSENVGDDQSDVRRVGAMLDAAHNIRKTYAVQDGRLYASMGGWSGLVGGVALNYADVFDGALFTVAWGWFAKLPAMNGRFWSPKDMTRPDPEQIALAKSRGRYFFVQRKEEVQAGSDWPTEIVNRGYKGMGIQSVKHIQVPEAKMGHYGAYDPDIFEQAITFLDADLSKLPPKSAVPAPPSDVQVPSKGKSSPGNVNPADTKPATPSVAAGDDSAAKSAKEMNMAKNYLTLQKFEPARAKLQKIVESYPGTPAAKEAQKLLKEIEGK